KLRNTALNSTNIRSSMAGGAYRRKIYDFNNSNANDIFSNHNSDSRRNAETGHYDFRSIRRQIHGPPSQAAIPNVENVPRQSCPNLFRSTSSPYTPSGFEVLFVFVLLAHHRRRVVHFNVTAHPSAEWTARQIVEAFPFDSSPKYLLRHRDRIYGDQFRKQVDAMNIEEVLSAPRSPWQRAYVERVIGSIRRECLDHVIVLNEASLRRTLHSYFTYYHRSRLHLSLDKDSSDSRPVHSVGTIIGLPEVGGLHHRYERRVV